MKRGDEKVLVPLTRDEISVVLQWESRMIVHGDRETTQDWALVRRLTWHKLHGEAVG